MKCEDIIGLLKDGKKVRVRLTNELWEDSFGQKGMVADIVSMAPGDDENLVEFTLDYSELKGHNLSLQKRDWHIYKDGQFVGLGTALEAGNIGDDLREVHVAEVDEDVAVELVIEDTDSPLAEYLRCLSVYGEDDKPTYLEWLEKQYLHLSHHHVHPTQDECKGMSFADAETLMTNRVYEAALLAERLEDAGRALTNGHHFAQRVAAFAKERLREVWAGDSLPIKG